MPSPSRLDGSDSEGDGSEAQSCISNEEDFSEDDEVDYLALEIVNHLPADKAQKLMSNLRAKERAIQDLLRRNKSLLETCDKLDQENQSATERCDELSRRAQAAESDAADAKSKAAAAAAETSAPAVEDSKSAPKVDTSYFMKLEQRKEEKILRLTAENERLTAINRRCQEQAAQMDSKMQELMKESKQLRRKCQENEKAAAATALRANNREADPLDEEERLYQEMRQSAEADMFARRMKEQMLEQRRKLAQLLEQVLRHDVLGALCGWDSELSALDMQVEGVEKCLGCVGKGIRGPNSAASDPAAASGKKKQNKKCEEPRLDSAWVDEISSQLLDLFEAMRGNLDVVDSARHTLETASQRLGDGAASEVLDTVNCKETLRGAEAEAEWIQQHNAAWLDRVAQLGLQQVMALTGRAEATAADLQRTAPPGILPPGIELLLTENVQQFGLLKAELSAQSSVIEGLQADSIVIGRHVRTLLTEMKTHKTLIRERMAQGLAAQIRPVSDADARLADALRKQRGLEDRARKEASGFLEEFSSTVKRVAPSMSASASEAAASSMVTVRENCSEAQKGAKEVRAALAVLRGGLGRIHRELADKLGVVLDAIAGEPDHNASNASRGREEASEAVESKEKRKKGKKKGKSQAPQSGSREDASQQRSHAVVDEAPRPHADVGTKLAPKGASASAAKSATAKQPPAADPDAALREELAHEFAGESTPNETQRVVSGKDLLKELKELKSASDSLEERIAARLSRKGVLAAEGGDAPPKETPQSQKNALRKKKVLYA